MYNENLVEEVRDYLINDNDLAIECLEHLGDYDWLMIYSLDDLYNDYCGGYLDDVINLFVDSGMNATSYYRYYVRDGEVKDEDDMCYDIEEVLDDDDTVIEIIAEIDYGNINVPDDLYKMCHVIEWDVIKDDIHAGYAKLMNELYLATSVETFDVAVCTGSVYKRIRDCLISTKVFKATSDDYEILKDVVWEDVITHITNYCKDFCRGGVTIEKATEVYIMNNIL